MPWPARGTRTAGRAPDLLCGQNVARGGDRAWRAGRQRPRDPPSRHRAPSHVHAVPRRGAMMPPTCQAPLSDVTLLDYWAHDLVDGEAGAVEEHLFACGDCSARLEQLAALGTGLVTLVRQGRDSGIVSRTLLNR